jgi:hypothetical protein
MKASRTGQCLEVATMTTRPELLAASDETITGALQSCVPRNSEFLEAFAG